MKNLLNRILLVCAGLLIPANLYSLTLSDIRTEIRIAVKDNPTSSTFYRYTDTNLNNFINEAQREMVNRTWLSQRVTSYILTSGVTYYNLPTDYIVAQQVYFTDKSGSTQDLDEIAQKTLYDFNPAWERDSGQPESYWISHATTPQNQQSAPLRISYIPIPTKTSTGTVTIWYNNIVPNLSSDSHVPFQNRRHLYPYHQALAYHVIYRIKLREVKVDQAGLYQTLYENILQTMKQRLGEMPNYRPGAAIPGGR
jgi:hypothetical protein